MHRLPVQLYLHPSQPQALQPGCTSDLASAGWHHPIMRVLQTNPRGHKLQCSHFLHDRGPSNPPIVVYCHCNSGSRRDAEEAIYALLPTGITVFALDFAVCCRALA